MCLSPHEMSTEQIENRMEGIRRVLDKGGLDAAIERMYRWRLEEFEGILKERAEAGVY